MKKLLAVTAIAVAMASGSAMAMSAEEISNMRIKAMKQIAGNMQAIAKVAKGQMDASADTVRAAQDIKAMSGNVLKGFPKGSAHYRAKAEIWSDWAGFKKAAMDFEMASAALVTAAETMDRGKIGAALQATGKTCGGCHKPFRGPKPGQ